MARVAKGATNAVALCIRPSNHRNVDVVISAMSLDWCSVLARVRDARQRQTRERAVRHFSAFSSAFELPNLVGMKSARLRQGGRFKCRQKTFYLAMR